MGGRPGFTRVPRRRTIAPALATLRPLAVVARRATGAACWALAGAEAVTESNVAAASGHHDLGIIRRAGWEPEERRGCALPGLSLDECRATVAVESGGFRALR